jgi:hypothetical protein
MNYKPQESYGIFWNDFVVILPETTINSSGNLYREGGIQFVRKHNWYLLKKNGCKYASIIIPQGEGVGVSIKVYYARHIQYYNLQNIDRQMYLDGMSLVDEIIEYVPLVLLDEQFWKDAVNININVFKHLGTGTETKPIYEYGLSLEKWSLRFLPYSMRDTYFCERSIVKKRTDIQYAPPEIRVNYQRVIQQMDDTEPHDNRDGEKKDKKEKDKKKKDKKEKKRNVKL